MDGPLAPQDITAREKRIERGIKQQADRLSFIEQYVRVAVEVKKLRVFREHRQEVNTLLLSAFTEEGVSASFAEKYEKRTERLRRFMRASELPLHQKLKRKGDIALSSHIREVLEDLRDRATDPDAPALASVGQLMQILASEFEEAVERQQFVKTDRILQRAQESYADARGLVAANASDDSSFASDGASVGIW